MSSELQAASQPQGTITQAIHAGRLFTGSCFALISTAITFAVVASIMGPLKEQFVLTNEQVGWIAGAATWGFTLSILVLGPLCDALGMRLLMRFAFLCHAAGVLMMVMAGGFWTLFFGGLVISLGNGTVEAACNPLVATIYPRNKTHKLNQFHMWFPGGIVIGGVACYLLDSASLSLGSVQLWQVKLVLILLPTLVYGVLFTGQKFPLTERVQSGVPFMGMVKAVFTPLFILLFFCMMITASLELGPNRWVPSVLESGGIPGILVLAYINGLMAVLRYFAGPIVHRLSNTGVLLTSAVLAGLGLLLMSVLGNNIYGAFAAATIFAVGVCYFWPTMLGTAAERVPKSGAMGLAILGGAGMAIVGLVTTPQMGAIADSYVHQKLVATQNASMNTSAVLADIVRLYPMLALQQANNEVKHKELLAAAEEAQKAYSAGNKPGGGLPEGLTANALRMAMKAGPAGTPDDQAAYAKRIASGAGMPIPAMTVFEARQNAATLLGPAENYGGLMSFRYVAPLAGLLVVAFGGLYLRDRKRKELHGAAGTIEKGLAEGLADGARLDDKSK